jgi:hypothetical protein
MKRAGTHRLVRRHEGLSEGEEEGADEQRGRWATLGTYPRSASLAASPARMSAAAMLAPRSRHSR